MAFSVYFGGDASKEPESTKYDITLIMWLVVLIVLFFIGCIARRRGICRRKSSNYRHRKDRRSSGRGIGRGDRSTDPTRSRGVGASGGSGTPRDGGSTTRDIVGIKKPNQRTIPRTTDPVPTRLITSSSGLSAGPAPTRAPPANGSRPIFDATQPVVAFDAATVPVLATSYPASTLGLLTNGYGAFGTAPLDPFSSLDTFPLVRTPFPSLFGIEGIPQPTTIFPVNTFTEILQELATGAVVQPGLPPNAVLTGWVLHNILLAQQSTVNTDLLNLQINIENEPITTTGMADLVNSVLSDFGSLFTLMQNRINSLNTTQVMEGAITFQAVTISIMTAQSLITKALGKFTVFVTQTLGTAVHTDLPIVPIQELVTAILSDISAALAELTAALYGAGPTDPTTINNNLENLGVFGMWRTIVGADQGIWNSATINAVWTQFLAYEALQVAAILLLVEAYHFPNSPSVQKAEALTTQYLTRIMSARDAYAPRYPATDHSVLVVLLPGQDQVEFGQKIGTVWLIEPPQTGIDNLYKYIDAPVIANGVDIDGFANWRLPTREDVLLLLETVPPGMTEQDYLRSLGMTYNFNRQAPGTSEEIRFWVGGVRPSMATVNMQKSDNPNLSVSFVPVLPNILASVFAVHKY